MRGMRVKQPLVFCGLSDPIASRLAPTVDFQCAHYSVNTIESCGSEPARDAFGANVHRLNAP